MFGAISRAGSGLLTAKALEKLGLETVKVTSVSSTNSKYINYPQKYDINSVLLHRVK